MVRSRQAKAGLTRREWLLRSAKCTSAIPFLVNPVTWLGGRESRPQAPERKFELPTELFPSDPTSYRFSPAEDAFLEELEKTSFLFFWEQSSPVTGQVEDRSVADGGPRKKIASIASTGFYLTALSIAAERGWRDKKEILDRVKTTLRFTAKSLPHEHGFYYHFIEADTGQRAWKCELSSIDTCLLLCGVLTSKAYFQDREIQELASEIYERIDWRWMMNGGNTLSMGWFPDKGFLDARWDRYCELMMLYLLGIPSPTHAIPRESWDAWRRPDFAYRGAHFIFSDGPLFTHQFSHAWFDFRKKHDKFANYFKNSVIATKVHKLWSIEQAKRFPDYSENLWGVTASDSADGYTAWGGPPEMGKIDGSIVPCAAAGSLPFLPEETFLVLKTIRQKYGDRVWKRYGFVDAFNPLNTWTNPDVIGIDVGITILMAENARTGFVWEVFMKNKEAARGMEMVGFKPDRQP